jgi:hypothetical protein
MTKPKLIFTKYQNSFNVKVENMEQLEVFQIKQLQDFVEIRKGIFDFETYSFKINKKIQYPEFIDLLKHLNIDANVEENILKVQQNVKINFGQYKGMYFSELPDSYLLWLKSSYMGKNRDTIDLEIKSRNL